MTAYYKSVHHAVFVIFIINFVLIAVGNDAQLPLWVPITILAGQVIGVILEVFEED